MNKLYAIVASSMLALVSFQTFAADHEFTSAEVEEQIGTYLSRIQTTLAGNDTVSFVELTQMLVSAGNLLPNASAEGRRLMQTFPARLQVLAKQDRERQPIRAINLTVFADAALSYLDRNTILGKESPGTVREVRLGIAPAPPPALPPSPSVLSSTIMPASMQQSLLERGDSMLSLGDVSAARLLYQRAADAGVGVAALKLADTYDPGFLANHYLRGIKGDTAEAAKWYRKAASLGASQADERLRILEKSLLMAASPALAQPHLQPKMKVHHVVIQINQDDPAVMNLALNNADNMKKFYEDKGENVEIEFVAFGAGLAMMRSDKSPVKERLAAMSEHGVVFSGCANTKANQSRMENQTITLLPGTREVATGVVRIIELEEKGWTYLRP